MYLSNIKHPITKKHEFLGCATSDRMAVTDDKDDFEEDCQVLSC